nr:response regulator transcription factor [Bifidobacterium santillanense]
MDNDPWSARSIARWVNGRSPAFHVMWCCTSAAEALHRCLFVQVVPQVLLLDLALNEASGASVCARIRMRTDAIGVIGITAYDPDRYVDDMAKAGAQAVLAKERITAELADLIPLVAQGRSADPQRFMTVAQAHRVLSNRDSGTVPANLSERELQVLRMYAAGKSTQTISSELGISPNSVFTYVHRIVGKLGVADRYEAIGLCRAYDLL